MKEKTFEELIIEHNEVPESFLETPDGKEYMEHLVKLLQQVREATISECKEAIRKEHKTYTPFETHYQLPLGEQLYNLNNLPTDRIKTRQ